MWKADEGALTGLFFIAATDKLEKENIRGRYYHPIAQDVENPLANDEDLQDRLWSFTEELVKDFSPVVVESMEEPAAADDGTIDETTDVNPGTVPEGNNGEEYPENAATVEA